jgi:hypothetical protein
MRALFPELHDRYTRCIEFTLGHPDVDRWGLEPLWGPFASIVVNTGDHVDMGD